MNNFLLRFLDLFKGLYRIAGVNYEQLRAIVAIKLTMDNRRNTLSSRRKKNEEPSNAFGMSLLFYALFGIFPAMLIFNTHSLMVSMVFFFSYIMVMIAMTLITDFSSILLDTSDNTIILPRPVDGRTLFIARITHIMLYLGQLSLGLSLFSIIMVWAKFGFVFFVCFLVALVLAVLTALLITNVVYLLIMQFASEEKLKSVINYFQIIMAVAFMGGYQLMPRMIGRFDAVDYFFELSWWSYLIPPIWMGGSLEAIHLHLTDLSHLTLIALAVLFPVGGLYVVNKYLTPIFNKKIGVIGVANDQPVLSKEKIQKGKNWLEGISSRITNSLIECASFELVYKMLSRDRKIKLKIYPAMGYVLIFGLLFMFKGREDFSATWHNLHNTEYYLVMIYISFMITQVALREIPYSDDFKASWFYSSAPIDRPGEILSGMVKAIFIRLFLPAYIVISALLIFIWGIPVLDDIVFGLFNNVIILLIMASIGRRILPLSLEPSAREQSGNLMRGIIMMLCMAIPGGLHYVAGKWPLVMMSLIPVQCIVIYFMLRTYKSTEWSKITV